MCRIVEQAVSRQTHQGVGVHRGHLGGLGGVSMSITLEPLVNVPVVYPPPHPLELCVWSLQ